MAKTKKEPAPQVEEPTPPGVIEDVLGVICNYKPPAGEPVDETDGVDNKELMAAVSQHPPELLTRVINDMLKVKRIAVGKNKDGISVFRENVRLFAPRLATARLTHTQLSSSLSTKCAPFSAVTAILSAHTRLAPFPAFIVLLSPPQRAYAPCLSLSRSHSFAADTNVCLVCPHADEHTIRILRD